MSVAEDRRRQEISNEAVHERKGRSKQRPYKCPCDITFKVLEASGTVTLLMVP